jgi:anti-sigma B factor antagonist
VDLETRTEVLGTGACVVSVAGEVDLYTAPALERELFGAIAKGTGRVIIDLAGCGFIDSTALGIFVMANKGLRDGRGPLALVTDDPHILKVLEVTGLTPLFAIHPSRKSAESAGIG